MLRLRYAPPDHNHIWIEDINDVCQPASQTVFQPVNDHRSVFIASFEILDNPEEEVYICRRGNRP